MNALTFILSATAAIVVVLAARTLLRGFVAPGWISALWLIAFVRMLVPTVPESPLSAMHLLDSAFAWKTGKDESLTTWLMDQPKERKSRRIASRPDKSILEKTPPLAEAIATQASAPESQQPILVAGSVPSKTIHITDQNSVDVAPLTPPKSIALTPHQAKPNFTLTFVFRIWIAGVFTVLLIALIRTFHTTRALRMSKPIKNEQSLTLLSRCAQNAGVRRRIRLLECDSLASPALVGLFRPSIFLPTGVSQKLTEEELRHVFLHELAHLRRWDAPVAWLAEIATALHWFNPLAWIARRLQRADRELACDEFALKLLVNGEKDYGLTLLKIVALMRNDAAVKPALSMARHAGEITKRIQHIAKRCPCRRGHHVAAAFALAGVALLGATAAPSYKPAVPFPATDSLEKNQGRLQVAVFSVTGKEATDLLLMDSNEELFNQLTETADIETSIAAISTNSNRAKADIGESNKLFSGFRQVNGDVDAIPTDPYESFHGTRLEFSPENGGVHFVHALSDARNVAFNDKLKTPAGMQRLVASEFDCIRISTLVDGMSDGRPHLIGTSTPAFGMKNDGRVHFVFAKFDGHIPAKMESPAVPQPFQFYAKLRKRVQLELPPKGGQSVEGEIVPCGIFDEKQRNENPDYSKAQRGQRTHFMSITYPTAYSALAQNEQTIQIPNEDTKDGTRITFRRLKGTENTFEYDVTIRELVKIESTPDGGHKAMIHECHGKGQVSLHPGDHLVLRAPSPAHESFHDYLFIHWTPAK
jgi:beta-lactamase regulating signal transducer with metallopeptidase domain